MNQNALLQPSLSRLSALQNGIPSDLISLIERASLNIAQGDHYHYGTSSLDGQFIVINGYHWLLERSLRHCTALLLKHLRTPSTHDHQQLIARLCHQMRIVLRCSVCNVKGVHFPYFYQGYGDLLCFEQSAVSIPHFCNALLNYIDLPAKAEQHTITSRC